MLLALEEHSGWDPRRADVVVGTSAGAGVGAVIRGGMSIPTLLATPRPAESSSTDSSASSSASSQGSSSWPTALLTPSSLPMAFRELSRPWRTDWARVGAALLPEGRQPTTMIGARARQLHGDRWPDADLWICTVRLSDGELVTLGRDRTDVPVGTAVEASSAIPGFFAPVMIDGDRHVDGGVHSPTNADLLVERDLDLVIVSSPMSTRRRSSRRAADAAMRRWSTLRLDTEVASLRTAGHSVVVIEPDEDTLSAMGSNPMDPTRIRPSIDVARRGVGRDLRSPHLSSTLAVLHL